MRNNALQISIAILELISASMARAQTSQGREVLKDVWIDQQQKHPTLYQSAPVTQVVPTFNTITYALLVDKQDATISASDNETSYFTKEENLRLTGYKASPHLSISLKKVGLGFSGEAGQRSIAYSYAPTGSRNQGSYYLGQESHMDYRGFGVYLYWIVPHPFGKAVKPSLTVGNSSYAARHRVSALSSSNSGPVTIDDAKVEAFTYNVNKSEAGLNVGIQLLKKFTLIPWANYEYIDSSDATHKVDEAKDHQLSEHGALLDDDIQLMWHDQARFKYGLDFSVRLFDTVELHVGGLLGSLASLGPKNDQIKDKTISVSVAFDQKGN